jgi:hypothetical protein
LHCQHDIARLEVRDYGIGISAANQARIFNRFEQLVTDQPHDGFGIGLWPRGLEVGGTFSGIEAILSGHARAPKAAGYHEDPEKRTEAEP